jgi:phosphoglycerate dehydrogenase-like enzyme
VTNPTRITVFSGVANAAKAIQERYPEVDVIDITELVPPGATGEVLFGSWGPNAIEAAGRGVRWVQLAGTGIDRLAPELRAAPILTSARGAGAGPISEYVISAIGAFARGFPHNWLREAPETWNVQPAQSLAGATVGLIGFGGIARRVARIVQALDMDVIALRRTPTTGTIDGVEIAANLQQVLEGADHLVLAAPATEETHHILNADSLTEVKPGVHVVNIARGALIDQEALRVALDDGRVARASLDVTDPEPLPAGHWLYEHPKVFLTPHASWVGNPPGQAATEIFLDNLGRYLRGEELFGLVTDGY